MRYDRVLLVASLLAVTACNEQHLQCVALISGGSYCLQSSATVTPFEVQQKVDTHFRGRSDTLIVELEVDAAGLRFVGLTPFGQKVLQLNYDNRAVSATTFTDSRINPALLVALLQLTLWPADAVRAGLEAPLTMEETIHRRNILNRDELTMSIDRSSGQPPYRRIQISVPTADLKLVIETLEPMRATERAQ
jgi:uncharacterized protein DUF3261